MRKARPPKKRYKEIPFKKFLGEYSKENRADGGRIGYEDGGMLVQPSDDGSRPGYDGTNKSNKYKITDTQLKNLKSKLSKLNEGLEGISFVLGKTPTKKGTTIRLANNARVFRDFTGTSHFSAAPTEDGLQKLIDKSNEIKATDTYKKYVQNIKPLQTSEDKLKIKKLKYARYKKQDPFNIYDTLKRYKAENFPGTMSQDIQIQHGQPKFTTQTLSRMGLIPAETNNLPVLKEVERIRNELVTSINKKIKNPNRSIADKKILIEEFNDTMKGLRGQLKGSNGQGLVNFELLDIDEKGNVKKLKDIGFNPKKGLAYGSEIGNLDLSKITKEQADEIIALGKKQILKTQQKPKNILQIVRNNKQKSITDAAIKTASIGGFDEKIKVYCGGKASGGRIGLENGTDVCPAATKDPEGFLKRLTADAQIGKFFKSPKAVAIAKNVARAGLNAVNPLSFVGGEIFYVGLDSANSVGKGMPLDEALDKAFIFYNFDRTEKKIMAKAKEQGFDENQLNLLQSTINLNKLDNTQLGIEKQFELAKNDPSEMSSDLSMGAEMNLPEVNKQIADESQKYINSLDKMGFDLNKDESYNTGFNYLDNVFRKKTKDELVKVYNERKRKVDPEGGFIGDAIKPIFDTQSYTQPLKYAADVINPFTKNVPFETDRTREQRYLNEMEEKELYLYNKRRGFDLDSVLDGTSPYIDKAVEDRGYGQAILGKGLFQDYSGIATNKYASGGIASLTDTIPPESGPTPQGLPYVYNNVKKI